MAITEGAHGEFTHCPRCRLTRKSRPSNAWAAVALAEALNQSSRALDIAKNQYEHGLADFLTVLDAQRTMLNAQQSLTQSDQTVATDLVALYKALGGGWSVEKPKTKSP